MTQIFLRMLIDCVVKSMRSDRLARCSNLLRGAVWHRGTLRCQQLDSLHTRGGLETDTDCTPVSPMIYTLPPIALVHVESVIMESLFGNLHKLEDNWNTIRGTIVKELAAESYPDTENAG